MNKIVKRYGCKKYGNTAKTYDDCMNMIANEEISTMCLYSKDKGNTILYTQKYVDKLHKKLDDAIDLVCLIEHNFEKYEEFGCLEKMKEYYFDYGLEKVYELKKLLLNNKEEVKNNEII